MPDRVLITGIEGFTGRYLRTTLEEKGYDVHGITRHEPRESSDARIDLLDRAALGQHVKELRPNYLIHLAAITFVAHDDAAEIYSVNLIGSLNLLDAVARANAPLKKIVLASSANVYGRPARSPVDESMPAAPVNHYGVSKYAMELMAARWFDRLPILLVRPFNYTGIGQDSKFLIPKLVKCFSERAADLDLGNTTVVREFMDVRDVGQAYAHLLAAPAASDHVNLCSGMGHRLDEVLKKLRQLTGFMPTIHRSEALMRGSEIPELVGSADKLRRLCPQIRFRPLEETLSWMLGAST
jgi:nucleoside-diphosphate-sugar epimerase